LLLPLLKQNLPRPAMRYALRYGRSSLAVWFGGTSAGSGLGIAGGPRKLEEMRVSRHLAPVFILVLALTPLAARAQVNIDQDKSPAHIFASDCAVCHKSTRGLANGRGSSALSGFLTEHYTSSKEEAASVAAYVLSAGGAVGTAAPAREDNPDSPRGRAATADAKPDAKPEPKTHRTAKPDDEPGVAGPAGPGGKQRRAVRERGKPKDDRSASAEPATPGIEKKPPADHHGPAAATHAHNATEPVEAAPPAAPAAPAAAVAAVPAASAAPEAPQATPAAPSASVQPQPAAATPPPADNIPD
jgi:hypothetical protein